ncbi:MAG TPA: LysM peptidoglycan-binding domain-containing protein [Steroidobacteraceae bacterium]|nr:LysM peptidoglycan-binding domain-containing protein [Steroidobacteraceae bacterium]
MTARQAVIACLSLSGALALGGCSLFHHRDAGQAAASAAPAAAMPAAQSDTTAAVAEQQTVTDALGDADEPGTTTVIRDAGPQLKAGAPKDYVVKRGDTLWGISNMFLKDPWLWPEIWYVNPDIHNPHRIYPGDTVHLALGRDGRTALQVVSSGGGGTRLDPLLRSTPLNGPIATIPYSAISAFLSRPGVMTRDEVKAAPYVVALRDMHQVAGTGSDLYIKKLSGDTGTRYSVMHIDEELKDPQSGRHLGYMAIYAGTAQLTRSGPVARVTLVNAARETLKGDVLIAETGNQTSDFLPHQPQQPIDGRIIAVVNNVLLAGQFEVAAINRGSDDGLDRGTVLAIDEAQQTVDDHCAYVDGSSTCFVGHGTNLPIENEGSMLVFKTYQKMSYALILGSTVPIHISDHVRNP